MEMTRSSVGQLLRTRTGAHHSAIDRMDDANGMSAFSRRRLHALRFAVTIEEICAD
jgi:hypothetical protein